MADLWYKYKNADIRKKQTLHSIGVGFAFFAVLFVITKTFHISLCPIKNLFGISCFGCGMTRGFVSVLSLDFKAAFEYNVMSVPLFAGICLYCIFAFCDILFDTNLVYKIENQLAKKYMYPLYIALLALATYLNGI